MHGKHERYMLIAGLQFSDLLIYSIYFRFNCEEAYKVFDEMAKNGIKIVLKNKMPACTLIIWNAIELLETVEDNAFSLEAKRCIKNCSDVDLVNEGDISRQVDITEDELKVLDELQRM